MPRLPKQEIQLNTLKREVLTRIIIIIIITFILIQEKGFTESLLNWKTSTGPNSAPFLYYTNFGNGEC